MLKVLFWNVSKHQSVLLNLRCFSNIVDDLIKKVDLQPNFRKHRGEDVKVVSVHPIPTSRRKLKGTLEEKEDAFIPHEARLKGECSAQEYEIDEVLSECLTSKVCETMFNRKRRIVSGEQLQMVEIESVHLDLYSADITVVWTSKILNNFVQLVKERKGDKEAQKILTTSNKKITTTLQDNEAKFRTYLVSKMNFKRVPRIFFKPYQDDRPVFKSGEILSRFRPPNVDEYTSK